MLFKNKGYPLLGKLSQKQSTDIQIINYILHFLFGEQILKITSTFTKTPNFKFCRECILDYNIMLFKNGGYLILS
jgi:hypothetical protein